MLVKYSERNYDVQKAADIYRTRFIDAERSKLEDLVGFKSDLIAQKNRFVKKVKEQLRKLKINDRTA